MKKLLEIPDASEECFDDQDESIDKKTLLIKSLENKGHKVIAVGRGLLFIERGDLEDKYPVESLKGKEYLRISIHGDPDLMGDKPECLYLEISKLGFSNAYLEVTREDGKQRIFKLSSKTLKDEFE